VTRDAVPGRGFGLLALVGTLGLIVAVFFLAVRPWYLRWGSTDQELQQALPGDEIIPNATGQETRAITIRAPAPAVWPWLAQLGQDRGGFYSYDLLENLVGCEMPTADVLRPEKQTWRIGGKLWMYPSDKAGGAGFATLRIYRPGEALGFGTRAVGTPLSAPESGSWSFIVRPIDSGTTRLLIRGRGAPGRSLLGVVFDRAIFEPVHFVMERRTMTGIRQLAEEGSRHRLHNNLQLALWTIVFGLFAAAAVQVVRTCGRQRSIAATLITAAVFQMLTLGQPPFAIGVLLVAAAAIALGWAMKREGAPSNAEEGESWSPVRAAPR
jgi:hypothetical protein